MLPSAISEKAAASISCGLRTDPGAKDAAGPDDECVGVPCASPKEPFGHAVRTVPVSAARPTPRSSMRTPMNGGRSAITRPASRHRQDLRAVPAELLAQWLSFRNKSVTERYSTASLQEIRLASRRTSCGTIFCIISLRSWFGFRADRSAAWATGEGKPWDAGLLSDARLAPVADAGGESRLEPCPLRRGESHRVVGAAKGLQLALEDVARRRHPGGHQRIAVQRIAGAGVVSVRCEPVSTWQTYARRRTCQTASDCHSAQAAERRSL